MLCRRIPPPYPAGRISERCGSNAERRSGVLIPPFEEVANGNRDNINKLNRWVDHARVSSSTALYDWR